MYSPCLPLTTKGATGATGATGAAGATGTTGARGPSGSAGIIMNETPTGTIDGVNDDFVCANTPLANKLQVFLAGVLQTLTTDYTVSVATITFVVPPAVGPLRVTYIK